MAYTAHIHKFDVAIKEGFVKVFCDFPKSKIPKHTTKFKGYCPKLKKVVSFTNEQIVQHYN